MADRRSSETKPTTQPRGENTPSGCSSSAADRPEWAEHSVVDRRSGIDRRDMQALRDSLAQTGASAGTGLERRRGPGRRRSDFAKSAEEGEMTREQFLFIQAIEAFKRVNERTYPTWSDVLEVVRLLGYRKTMPSNLSLPQCEDWREPADSPAGCEWSPSKKSRDAA